MGYFIILILIGLDLLIVSAQHSSKKEQFCAPEPHLRTLCAAPLHFRGNTRCSHYFDTILRQCFTRKVPKRQMRMRCFAKLSKGLLYYRLRFYTKTKHNHNGSVLVNTKNETGLLKLLRLKLKVVLKIKLVYQQIILRILCFAFSLKKNTL